MLLKTSSVTAILALVIAATVALAAGCGDGLPKDAVAKVGDTYVTTEDFTEKVEAFASMYGLTEKDSPAQYKDLETQVLKMMVQTAMAIQKAPALGVTVSDGEILAEIDAIAQDYFDGDQAALKAALEEQGQTFDDLKKETEESLVTQRVRDAVTKNVASASSEEIAAYYEENRGDYSTEPSIDGRHILITVSGESLDDSTTTTTEAADPTTTATEGPSEVDWARALATASQVRLDLLTGSDWTTLAKLYSEDESTKYSGGEFGPVVEGDLVAKYGQEFEDVLWTLEVNAISEPIRTANGYHLIQVTKITESREQTLDEARSQIAETLLAQAQAKVWERWFEDTAAELGVVYRSGLEPTTTTIPSTTTTAKP